MNPESVQTETDDAQGPPISPEEYAELLGGIRLVNLGLDKIQAEVTNRQGMDTSEELVPQFVSSCQFKTIEHDGVIYGVVLQHLNLIIGDGQNPFFTLQLTFQLDYITSKAFTQPFFDVFKNGPLIAHVLPYLRELVQTTMMRMNIEPYILPLAQFDASSVTHSVLPPNV